MAATFNPLDVYISQHGALNQLANQQTATASTQLNQVAQYRTYYIGQQARQAYSGDWPKIEEVEEKVDKAVYHAAFDLRRFLDKLIHLPVSLIDRVARCL